MQVQYYDSTAHIMAQDDHRTHDLNPDYYGLLLGGVICTGIALDFGCGTGRNVDNLLRLGDWRQVHGADLSSENIKHARSKLQDKHNSSRFELFVTSGVDAKILPDDTYSFVMSTIVLQHIAVWSIRYAILKDIYRAMNQGGIFSFQMAKHGAVEYRADHWDAAGTNGYCDCKCDVDELQKDLAGIGFKDIVIVSRPEWDYLNKRYCEGENWVFVKCRK